MNVKNCIFKNERTMASAGSGKTYTLTNRYIALVAGGAKPEEICALTFTRKAAAEFFDKTMTKLAEASSNPEFAANLSAKLAEISPELADLKIDDYKNILESFAKASAKLNLKTIDSFTSDFARLFSAELGILEEVQILDDFESQNLKRAAIFKALETLSTSEKNFAAFAQAFKEANFGSDAKSINFRLEKFIQDSEEIFFDFPDIKYWGAKELLGSDAPENFDKDTYFKNLDDLNTQLLKIEDEKEYKTKVKILNFFEKSNGEEVSSSTAIIIENLAQYFAKNKTSKGLKCKYPHAKKNIVFYDINENEARAIDALILQLVNHYKKRSAIASRAIYKITDYYESIYDALARSCGKMTFADMPRAICENKNSFAREIVEYRFDTKFNHWLFDEFQDTSRIQWRVFDDLISEAVLNSDGKKTFYYVGDKKQSIYAWRGGDSALFDEIFEKFKSNIFDNPQIKTSWRSCPAIIDFVNTVFSDTQAIQSQYGKAAAQIWQKDWQAHDVAKPNLQKKGIVSAELCKEEEIGEAVYKYLKSINPTARGLSCAVLVQRNSTAESIIDTIRKRAKEDKLDMRVAGELEINIASDNQAVCALLAAVEAITHPEDTFANAYLKFTPLKEFFESECSLKDFERNIAEFGFKTAFEPVANFLLKKFTSVFLHTRVCQFLEACAVFDSKFERNADLFIKFIKEYKVREGAAADTIQVMSIHKSKGLDFDIVILPELSNAKGNHSPAVYEIKKMGAAVLPTERICKFDQTLTQIRDEISDTLSYESLCKFYVALTRAKRAIHIILPPCDAKKDDELLDKKNFAYLIFNILKKVCDISKPMLTPSSNPSWIDEFALPVEAETQVVSEAKKVVTDENIGTSKVEILQSSNCENLEAPAQCSVKISPNNFYENSAKIVGLCAHSILENLDLENCPLDKAAEIAQRLYTNNPQEFNQALQMVKSALAVEEISNIFKCKKYWVEFPYCQFKNGVNFCGRFDRVNFENDCATIYDFKTDRLGADFKALYTPQLSNYADALSKLKSVKKISLKIVALSEAKIYDITS